MSQNMINLSEYHRFSTLRQNTKETLNMYVFYTYIHIYMQEYLRRFPSRIKLVLPFLWTKNFM